jgi:hypothetical protein
MNMTRAKQSCSDHAYITAHITIRRGFKLGVFNFFLLLLVLGDSVAYLNLSQQNRNSQQILRHLSSRRKYKIVTDITHSICK